jgi:hypothetical protein
MSLRPRGVDEESLMHGAICGQMIQPIMLWRTDTVDRVMKHHVRLPRQLSAI